LKLVRGILRRFDLIRSHQADEVAARTPTDF